MENALLAAVGTYVGSWEDLPKIWLLAPVCSIIALIFARFFYGDLIRQPEGNDTMKTIAQHVRDGASAYLNQQYKVVTYFFIGLFVFLSLLAFVFHVQHPLVPFAFITGGFFSGLSGFLGMKTATQASSRTAEAARQSLDKGLRVAFRSGAVMGLVVVGLGLLDICLWFICLFLYGMTLKEITVTMLCFGMGASTQALFARVGGGIFTKAADVGADLVGKVEAGIPEDDPRNPATIADNVGDNVGDVAGMGADLYESYCGSILATAALGVAAFYGNNEMMLKSVILPMILAGIGIIASIIGIFVVRTKEGATQKDLLRSLSSGVNISSVLIVIASGLLVFYLLPGNKGVFGSIIAGLLAGIIIGQTTEYYTSYGYGPAKGIAGQSVTGPATVILEGIAVGMFSCGLPVLTICVGILVSFSLAGGFSNISLGLYGIGMAAVSMLSTLGITLATDAYGPIADNAGGNAEMSHLGPEVRQRTDALDSLGNTTAATGKGFAIGSAALTAMALLAAYLEEIRVALIRVASMAPDKIVQIKSLMGGVEKVGVKDLNEAGMQWFMETFSVHLMNPYVLVGMFIGAALPLVFCAMTIKAVGRAARQMVEEVRRQFREISGIMEGTGKPDYARCVAISTQATQKEMIIPSMMAIAVPILTGLVIGVSGVLGLLIGSLSSGFAIAIMLNNAGGAWDNAKKFIEGGEFGGKGSQNHKACVVGDTVGDPFKDTAGPSLNILLKLLSMVSIITAGLTVKFSPIIQSWLHLN
ncbi:MAG: sodium-translocating pyrophosphatase [Candidatus Wallbacteria bacterium]|nr:sodium-translocating pyrophosphatase [Candidatus Wallbacteria bacterium]